MAYLKPQSPLRENSSGDYFYPLTTADQVIMEDGSRLNGYLSEQYNVVSETIDTINNSKISMELIWENADTSSIFEGQTVSLASAANYDTFLIEFTSNHYPVFARKNNSYYPHQIFRANSETVYLNFYYRSMKITDDSFTVGNTNWLQYSGNTNTIYVPTNSSTSYLKPYRIYGIKGVPQ